MKRSQQPLKTIADYREKVIGDLFNTMLLERYNELSKQANPPFADGLAGIGGFIGGLDTYDISVVAKPGELEKGFKAVWREAERVNKFGFTSTELERAKIDYLSQMDDAVKEKDKTNSEDLVLDYQNFFLNQIAAPGIVKEYDLVKNDLATITLNEVDSLGHSCFTSVNRDVLILAPDKEKAGLPDETKVNSWLTSVENENLQPYKDDVSSKPMLAGIPVSGKITSEHHDAGLNITSLTLSNGIKVIIKPTDFKDNELRFAAFAAGGTSITNDADYQSAANAAVIIQSSGIGNYTSTQLDKFLSGKQLVVSPYINERFQGINGSTTPKDFETALEMIYGYFTEPRKDTAIFQGIIEQQKAILANRAASPSSVFSDSVNAVLGNYNLRRTGPTLEKLQQINLDKVYSIFKDRFADASGFTFVFVGNIDTISMKPLLEKYLGSLTTTTSTKEVARDLDIHVPYGKLTKTVYKGTEPKSNVLLVYSGLYDYSQENQIKLDALKECLEIRLLQRLREDESGVYSPAVFVITGKYPQSRYSLIVQFSCAPQNVEKLIASANDEIAKLRDNGPLQENLDKWRAEDKQAREPRLKTNNFWLSYLISQLQNNEPLKNIDQYDSLRSAITVSDLQAAAGKYLSGENYIRMILLPESSHSKTD